MSHIVDIAEAVAADEAFSGWSASVGFAPEFELKELSSKKVCIIPSGVEYRRVSRIQVDVTYRIELGFLYRSRSVDAGSLIEDLEEIVYSIMGKQFDTAVCIGVSFDPLYGAEELRTKSQFTSVVNLTLKEVESWQ